MRTGRATDWTSGWWRCLALALAVTFLRGAGAHAQMLPFVPGPVTTPEIARYADTLGLSDAQRLAALDVHNAYRRDFRALEDGQVKAFIQDLTGLARVFTREGFRIPERSEFENLIEQFDGIITKAKSVDRSLFDRLAPILTESQLASLPSVRAEREMQIYSHLMDAPGELNPGAPVVLSTLVRELDLSEEEIARTEESLRQYERNATRRMRKLYQLLMDAAVVALDTLDRTGLRDMTPMEMMQLEGDEEFEADMRATFDEGSKPLQAELFAASQENLRLLRATTPLLSPDHVEALRHKYHRRAYARVYRELSPWRHAYREALALESLDPERREQVAANRDQFRRQEDQLIDRIVQRVEAWREYRAIEQLEGGEEALEERIDDYTDDRDNLGVSALAALRAILSAEEFASVEPGGDGDDGPDVTTGLAMAGGGGTVETEVVVEGDGTDFRVRLELHGMPRPMTEERRDELARLGGLAEGPRAVLGSLHDDYLDDYAAALQRMRDEDDAAEADDAAEPTAKERAEQATSRLAILAAIDEALFESMGLVLEGEAASRAVALGRDLRTRERATAAARASAFVFGREESYVDFVAVVLAMDQSVEIVAAAQAGIEQYAETVGPLVEERLDALGEAQRQMRVARRMQDHGRAGDSVAKKLAEKAEASRRQVSKLDARVRDQNHQLLEAIESALEDELGWTLRVAYQRTAFPDVYEDELGMEAAFVAVRELPDLTTPQRRQVEGVVNDYRAAFSGLSERMVELRRQREFDFTAMQMPSQEVINGEIELERLRFDRREAGSRAILRLRLVLDDAQVARSGLRELPVAVGRRAFD